MLILPIFLLGSICIATHYYFQQRNLHYKFRWLFGCGIMLLCVCLGMYISKQNENNNRFENQGKQGVFKAEIIAAPVNKPKSFLLRVKTTAFAADSLHFKTTQGNAILYIAKTESSKALRIGDQILVCAKLNAPKQGNNPEEFDYTKYLARKGIGATSFVDSTHWKLTQKNTHFSITQKAEDFRTSLLNVYKAHHLEGDEYSVLAALTLGYQDEIQDDLYTSYSNSGALHILSVSGLHVGIIYAIFAFALAFLDKSAIKRIIKSVVIILLLWGYALLTGLSPSVMRATVMFSMVAFASVFNYKSQIYNTIFFSAFILLIYDPNYLFDVSFILSYTAVLSIVFFQPYLKKLCHFTNKPLRWSWDMFCVSVAAQIGTFPLGLYYFHKFSNHFLLTNFIAIPISSGIIYLAVLLFIVSPVPYLNDWIGIALKWLLKAQNNSIVYIDHLPYSTFHIWINEVDVILIYLFILGLTIFFMKKRFSMMIWALSCLLILQVGMLFRKFQSQQSNEVVIYSNPKLTAVDFIDKGAHCLFTTDSAKTQQIAQTFWLKMQLASPQNIVHTANYHQGFFSFSGKHFYILTDSIYHNKSAKEKLSLDYLILGNKAHIKIKDIANLFEVKTLVIDDTYSEWKAKSLALECREKGISCYSMKEKGCFTIKL